jgi:hypothetical protein
MAVYTTSSTIQSRHLGDWIASISLLPICAYYIFKGTETTVLDTLCMLVFDTGQLVAGSLGAPLMHIGGAAMLVLMPALLVWYFWAHGYRFGIQVFLFWLGQDLVFLGRTAISLEGRRLELLDAYQFDVHSILNLFQLVPAADVIGQTLFMLGTVAFVTLLILPLYVPR